MRSLSIGRQNVRAFFVRPPGTKNSECETPGCKTSALELRPLVVRPLDVIPLDVRRM